MNKIKRIHVSVSLFAALILFSSAFAEVPDRFVEYVESTDTATYIDTGIKATPQTTRIQVTLAPTTKTKGGLFGSRPNNNDENSTYATTDNGVFVLNGTGEALKSFSFDINTIYTLEIYHRRGIVVGEEKIYDNMACKNEASNAEQKSLYFFTYNDRDGEAFPAGALQRFYSAAIYTNNTVLAGYYLPCVKNGVAALYDAVTGTILYPNSALTASQNDNSDVRVNGGLIEARLTLSCGEGGVIDQPNPSEWIAVGTDVSLKATPNEGLCASWMSNHEGAVQPLSYSANPLSFKMPAGGVSASVTFDSDQYAPRTSDLTELINAANDGDEIHLAEGDYIISKEISLNKSVVLSGAGMDKTFIRQAIGANIRAVNMTAEACVRNLTIIGFTNHLEGAGIYMTKGTADTVRVTQLFHNRYHLKEGVGIRMTGGVVTNSVIDKNFVASGYGGITGVGIRASGGMIIDSIIKENSRDRNEYRGLGIYMDNGAKLIKSRIERNHSNGKGADSGNTYSSGIYIAGAASLIDQCVIVSNDFQGVHLADGEIRNSLIFGHKSTSTTRVGGVKQEGGRLYNCTITDNSANHSSVGLQMTKGTAVNNIIYGNGTSGSVSVSGGTFNTNIVDSTAGIGTLTATGNMVTDPSFVDREAGNYKLSFSSTAIDAGARIPSVATDLNSVSRLNDKAPDIGCYEYLADASGKLECAIIIPLSTQLFGRPQNVSVRTAGGNGKYTYKWYLNGVLQVDKTEAEVSFENLPLGKYSLGLTVESNKETYSETVTDAFSILSDAVYVDENSSNPIFPYATPDTAARGVNEAWNVLWKEPGHTSSMTIASGHYEITQQLACNIPVKITGAGRDVTILSGAPMEYVSRALEISADDVEIKDLTITGCTNNVEGTAVRMTKKGTIANVRITGNCVTVPDKYATLSSGCGINMSAGIVTNCVIDNNFADSSYGGYDGLGIYMSGGLVVDSEIAYNRRDRSQITGVGVGISGGTLRNCSIHHNSNVDGGFDKDTRGMGVNISGSGALVENCTIVSNGNHGVYVQSGIIRNSLIAGHHMTKSIEYGGGVDQTGGTILNCTIAGNSANTEEYGDILKTGGTMKNSIAQYATVGGVVPTAGIDADYNLIGVDPLFKNQAKGNYHLRKASRAFNAGNNEAWTGLADSVDLDGNPRISKYGNRVDIGCYENHTPPGTMFIVR